MNGNRVRPIPAIGQPRAAILLLAVLGLAGLVLAPLLGGYWLGDDYSNLYRVWEQSERGDLLRGTLAFLVSPVDAVGAFYRPSMMTSLAANYALFGADYTGWAATNFAVHLGAAALVFSIVLRLCPRDAVWPASAAALLFALHPMPIEGVAWVSARADGWVTLLTLGAFRIWLDARPGKWARCAAVPLLLVPALGFKESAVIFPLQLAVFALLWPGPAGRPRWIALALTAVLAGLFLGLRLGITGSAVEAYRGSMGSGMDPRSLIDWWSALFAARHTLALIFTAAFLVMPLFVLGRGRFVEQRKVIAAFLAASGLMAATLLNLGVFADSGEGGRLLATPVAWWCIGIGALLGTLPSDSLRARLAGIAAAVAMLTSIPLTVHLVGEFRSAQDSMRALTAAVSGIAEAHPGLTLLLTPEMIGPVIAARNASGALVFPPHQDRPLLHRVLPTRDQRIERRHRELRNGLATRLAAEPPSDLEMDTIARLLEPAPPRPPEWIGCWDPEALMARIQPWPADRPWSAQADFLALAAEVAEPCGLHPAGNR